VGLGAQPLDKSSAMHASEIPIRALLKWILLFPQNVITLVPVGLSITLLIWPWYFVSKPQSPVAIARYLCFGVFVSYAIS